MASEYNINDKKTKKKAKEGAPRLLQGFAWIDSAASFFDKHASLARKIDALLHGCRRPQGAATVVDLSDDCGGEEKSNGGRVKGGKKAEKGASQAASASLSVQDASAAASSSSTSKFDRGLVAARKLFGADVDHLLSSARAGDCANGRPGSKYDWEIATIRAANSIAGQLLAAGRGKIGVTVVDTILPAIIAALDNCGPNMLLELWDLVAEGHLQRLGLAWLPSPPTPATSGTGGKPASHWTWFRRTHAPLLDAIATLTLPGRFRFICCAECRRNITKGETPKYSPLRHFFPIVPPMMQEAWLDAIGKAAPPGARSLAVSVSAVPGDRVALTDEPVATEITAGPWPVFLGGVLRDLQTGRPLALPQPSTRVLLSVLFRRDMLRAFRQMP